MVFLAQALFQNVLKMALRQNQQEGKIAAELRSQAEAMLAYNVFWYVTSPEEIHIALRRAHGLDTKQALCL